MGAKLLRRFIAPMGRSYAACRAPSTTSDTSSLPPGRFKLCPPIAKDALMAHWYFSSGSNSPRVGPLDDNAAHAHAQQHPEDLCWRDGMAAWKPVGDVPELAPSANVPPPSMPALTSEEHTSELQSLMRSSYAVFCLKKK